MLLVRDHRFSRRLLAGLVRAGFATVERLRAQVEILNHDNNQRSPDKDALALQVTARFGEGSATSVARPSSTSTRIVCHDKSNSHHL